MSWNLSPAVRTDTSNTQRRAGPVRQGNPSNGWHSNALDAKGTGLGHEAAQQGGRASEQAQAGIQLSSTSHL